jgi:hypothetical protein
MKVPVLLSGGRPVVIVGVGLLCPAGMGAAALAPGRPGAVPGFSARDHIADRKALKLMTRAVQLGVSGVGLALAAVPGWDATPPARRALYVGASPQAGDPDDLQPALTAATGPDGFSLARFADAGVPLIHPLWLVRGLSNNVLGFASAIWDLQGTNANYCDGPAGGWAALHEGAHAVAEGRADLCIAGGADALVEAGPLLGVAGGEGAAFVVFAPGTGEGAPVSLHPAAHVDPSGELGVLGAATGPVAVARALLARAGA